MTNPVKGEVYFECDGKNYRFKLGVNAQVLIEKKTGMSMTKFLKADRLEDLGTEGVRLIFWAGLTRAHPDLTEEAVGDLIDDLGQDRVIKIFEEAFELAKVKADQSSNGARPPVPATQQTGTSS